ncbi:MAG: DUF4249 family protein [Paludibacteraceae bacterium]|nr:DUF4249 family protein [Paludibacteraceae bacterium]
MKRLIYILSLAFVFAACQNEAPLPPTLIMEGWIDADGFPVIMIHQTYVLDAAPDTARSIEEIAEELLIPFGKVTVSDGTDQVVLTGRIDTAYLPPYIYTSVYMTGESGKTYTVTAQYKDFYASATTTIPPVASLDSLRIRQNGSLEVDVRAFMSGVGTDGEAYYALFARRIDTKQFRLCPLCVFSYEDARDGNLEMKVYNPVADTTNIMGRNHYFQNDTTLSVRDRTYQLKVARIDKASYRFWKAYNEQVLTSGVFFVPVYKNIPSNVEGGYGNISGMGSSFYYFNLSRDTTYRY